MGDSLGNDPSMGFAVCDVELQGTTTSGGGLARRPQIKRFRHDLQFPRLTSFVGALSLLITTIVHTTSVLISSILL